MGQSIKAWWAQRWTVTNCGDMAAFKLDRAISVAVNSAMWSALRKTHRTAVVFIGPQFSVRATVSPAINNRTRRRHVKVAMGRPNAKERGFLNMCRKGNTKPKGVTYFR